MVATKVKHWVSILVLMIDAFYSSVKCLCLLCLSLTSTKRVLFFNLQSRDSTLYLIKVVGKTKQDGVCKAPAAWGLAQKCSSLPAEEPLLKNCGPTMWYIYLAICNLKRSLIIQIHSGRETGQNVFSIIFEFKGFYCPAPFPDPPFVCKKVTRCDRIRSANLWNKDLKNSYAQEL